MEDSEESSSSAATQHATPSRLMISKIVCKNFKSYAGEKVLGPFHKCFSSIVGPNGSGKSNVIDSMLFVFGYRARKIRSHNVSVLIHNSDHHQNLQSCSVSVYFQHITDLPGDAYEVVPQSEFVVSRTALRDNTSYYQVNGKRIAFQKVASLLRKSGIDLDHNRFLILQGEVEQIALMKPKALGEHDEGMLEFLEDIIGTSMYKEPIQELEQKVEALNEARGEKLNRVKAAEKEKDSLEGAKKEAEEYLSMQNEMVKHQYRSYQGYIHELSQNEAQARLKREEVDAKLAEASAVKQALTKELAEKMKQNKKQLREFEQLSSEVERCKAQRAAMDQQDVQLREDVKNARSSLKKAQQLLKKEQDRLADLEAAPDRQATVITENERKIAILQKRKVEADQRLKEVMASIKDATKDLQKEKEEYENQLVGLSQVVNENKSKLDVAQAELDLYREKFTSGEKQLEQAKKQLATIQGNIKEKKREKKDIESSLPAKREELCTSQSQLQEMSQKLAQALEHFHSTRSKVDEARSSLQAHSSRGHVLEALMQQTNSGAIPGIYGRLGDLGSIDDKYDVAISTACGALDNIVVDTMETAIKCVEFLKRNNVGTATFIGLNKMEEWRRRAFSAISTPEGVPRLFDLVTVRDDKFKTAFYFALRDTLVSENLTQATRIGLQGRVRHRVVTLGGSLVDIAGTMTGGGDRPIRGKMSSKLQADISPQQLTNMERELQQREASMKDCSRDKSDLEAMVKRLRAEVPAGEKKGRQLERDLQVLAEQEGAVKERIATLQEANSGAKMDHEQVAKFEKAIQKHKKEYEKAVAAADEVKGQVEGLHEAIMEVGGSKVQEQKVQVAAVKKALDSASQAITKAKVAIKTSERNAKKCRDKISSLEKECEDIQQQLLGYAESLNDMAQTARDLEDLQEEIEEKLQKVVEQLSAVKSELTEMEKKESTLKEQCLDLEHEKERYVLKIKENSQKIKHFKQEISKLPLDSEDRVELSAEELSALDQQEVEYQITMLEEKLKQMTPNMAAIEEYKRKEEVHNGRLKELDAITQERDAAHQEFEAMRTKRLTEFMEGFSVITLKLKEMYQMITLGGDAELELVDSLDPFSEGIVFSVRPPKKSWKNISNLSGGEKTLSSLALVFALHHYKPSPLYVMDEIDAALDFKNVSIVANYIKERTKDAQFIIISLRNNMFELADRLIGIYKTHNCTKSVTIDPHKIGQAVIPSAGPSTASYSPSQPAPAGVLVTKA